jgi:hypothetical protein
MDRRYFQWPAQDSLAAIEQAIERGDAAEIALPQSAHHALCVHLAPPADAADAAAGAQINANGGPELLRAIAGVAGLGELARLEEPLRRSGYSVGLHSPDPTLVLLPPEHHPLWISVECRRRRDGELQPYEFRVGGRRLHVLRVLQRSGDALRQRVTVLVADGRRFVLEHDAARGAWYLHGVLPPANPAQPVAP